MYFLLLPFLTTPWVIHYDWRRIEDLSNVSIELSHRPQNLVMALNLTSPIIKLKIRSSKVARIVTSCSSPSLKYKLLDRYNSSIVKTDGLFLPPCNNYHNKWECQTSCHFSWKGGSRTYKWPFLFLSQDPPPSRSFSPHAVILLRRNNASSRLEELNFMIQPLHFYLPRIITSLIFLWTFIRLASGSCQIIYPKI